MAAYRSVEELRRVVGGFADEVRSDDRLQYGGAGLMIVFRLTDLETSVVVDTTIVPKPGAFFEVRVGEPEPAHPTCVFETTSDTFDRLFLGDLPPTIALVTGAVKAHGNYMKATKTIPALKRAIPYYREWRKREGSDTMAAYANVGELKRIFGGFADEVRRDEKSSAMIAGSGIVEEYKLTDLGVSVVIDASVKPRPGAQFDVYIGDPNSPKPTCWFELTSDAFDSLFMGELKPVLALASGQVKAHGNVTAVLKLLPMLARLIPLYRTYRGSQP